MNPQLIVYAVPFFLITVLIETYFSYREQRGFVEAKDSLTSIGLGLGNLFIGILSKSLTLGAFFFVYENWSLFKWEYSLAWIWVFTFFAEDFTYYWYHRFSHEIRYLWASHMPHHSSPKYNLAAALRQSWTSIISGSFIVWLWLPLLGVHPFVVFFFQQVSLLYQYWIHTEFIKKMPNWFEYIFNTPSHHRVHHGMDLKYLDANYAGVLIIWDRMFGSLTAEQERPNYGLTKQIESYNPARIAVNEWIEIFNDLRKARNISDAWKYVFGPPGWSHDKSKLTVAEMREKAKENGR